MKLFTVHAPPDGSSDLAERAERMAFVKEGFSWPALFVPLIWLLWHRMWWAVLGWLAAAAVIAVAGELAPGANGYMPAIALAFSLWFAAQANDLRRWSLDRKGWTVLGLAGGSSREESELGFFSRWLSQVRRQPARAAVASPGPVHPRREEPGIGLFPGA